ncbi:hypothetical protein D3C87_966420 [compost metagenome]
MAIIEDAGGDVHLLRQQAGVAVIDVIGRYAQCTIARQLAPLAIQIRGAEVQHTLACMLDLAIDIRQVARLQAQIGTVDGDAPAGVIQLACLDDRVARARLYQGTLGIVQIGYTQGQLPGAQAAALVDQCLPSGGICRDGQQAIRRYDGLAGRHIARQGRQADIRCADLAAAHVDRCARQLQLAGRHVLAASLQGAGRFHRQIANRGKAAIGAHACRQQTIAAQAARRDRRIAQGRQATRIVQQTADIQGLVAPRIQHACVEHVTGDLGRNIRARAERALYVAHAGRVQVQGAGARLQQAARIVDGTAQVQIGRRRDYAVDIDERAIADDVGGRGRGDLAFAVVQAAGLHRQGAVSGDFAICIVQLAGHGNRHTARACLQQMAAPVAQAVRLHAQGASRGGSVGVIQQASLEIDGAIADDAAAGALQGGCRDGQGAAARMLDLAARIRQGGRVQSQIITIDGDTPGAVVQLARLDDSVARARLDHGTFGVVEIAHV